MKLHPGLSHIRNVYQTTTKVWFWYDQLRQSHIFDNIRYTMIVKENKSDKVACTTKCHQQPLSHACRTKSESTNILSSWRLSIANPATRSINPSSTRREGKCWIHLGHLETYYRIKPTWQRNIICVFRQVCISDIVCACSLTIYTRCKDHN